MYFKWTGRKGVFRNFSNGGGLTLFSSHGGLSTRWGLKITWFHSSWGELSSHSLPSPKYASNWKCRRKLINLFKVPKTPFSYFWSDNNNSIQFQFRYIKLHTEHCELHTIHLEIRPISSFCFFKNYIFLKLRFLKVLILKT